MAITPTLRFLLDKYGSGSDPHPNRVEFNEMIDAIENNASMGAQGITDARPAAGKGRRFYWDETAGRMYYDDGTGWKDLNPNGGGGAGAKVTPGVNGIEGVSVRSARADHTHRIDLATAAVDGAMPKTDKAKLDAATAAATANAIAVRDAGGRISVATPTTSAHAATKAYVDGLTDETLDYVDGRTQFRHMEYFSNALTVPNNSATAIGAPTFDATTAVNAGGVTWPEPGVIQFSEDGVFTVSTNFNFNGGGSLNTSLYIRDYDLGSPAVWASAPIRNGSPDGTLPGTNFSVVAGRKYRIFAVQQSGGPQTWSIRVKVTRIH